MFGPCFVMQCLVSFLVLQSSGRESLLLYFNNCFHGALLWSLLYVPWVGM